VPPANLHVAERRLDLPRRSCTQTTTETRSLVTRFGRSLHPRGMTTGAPPQIATPAAPDPGNTPPSPASLSLCRHGYNNSPPLIFMRRLGLQSLTGTLPCTAKYNSSPIIIGLYKYSTQYLTKIVGFSPTSEIDGGGAGHNIKVGDVGN
jgi:hypothetical protein